MNSVVYACVFGLVCSYFKRKNDATPDRRSTMRRALAALGQSVWLFTLLLAVLIPISLFSGYVFFSRPHLPGGPDGGIPAIAMIFWCVILAGFFAAISFLTAILAFPKFRWVGCPILFIAAVSLAIWLYMR